MAIDPTKVKRYTTNFSIPVYEYAKTKWHECIESAFDVIDTSLQAVKVLAQGVVSAAQGYAEAAEDSAEDAAEQVPLAAHQVTLAAAQVVLATAERVGAEAAAALAAQLIGAISGTSTTSLSIGTGTKVFTTQANEQYATGVYMMASSQANSTNFMFGQVVSYSGTTLTINVQVVGGSGTYADWNLSLSGVRGAQGPAGGTNLTYTPRSSNTQFTSADTGKAFNFTASFTQTLAAVSSLGSSFFALLRNSSSGDVTLDPNGSETIGGATTAVMKPGDVWALLGDGTNLQVIRLQGCSQQIIDSGSGNWTPPPGCYWVDYDLTSGGGGINAPGANTPKMGGGGARATGRMRVTPGVPVAYAVGAGGSSSGGDGGATTLASVTASGGKGATTPTPGDGGTATGGDINLPGARGHAEGSDSVAGYEATSGYAPGGVPVRALGDQSTAGNNPGCGAVGSRNSGTGTGAAGFAGRIILKWV